MNRQYFVSHWPIVLKFDTLVHYGPRGPENCENPLPVKFKMADGAQIFNI